MKIDFLSTFNSARNLQSDNSVSFAAKQDPRKKNHSHPAFGSNPTTFATSGTSGPAVVARPGGPLASSDTTDPHFASTTSHFASDDKKHKKMESQTARSYFSTRMACCKEVG